MCGQLLRAASVSLSQLQPSRCQRPRQLGALEQCTGGGDEDAQIAASNSLQGFYSLAGNFGVSFRFAEALTRRVKRDLLGLEQSAKISQPPLSASDIVVDDYVEPRWQRPSERCDDHCVGRSMEAAHTAASARTRELIVQLREFPQGFGYRDQLGQRHGAR
jgi:hypothetical protein